MTSYYGNLTRYRNKPAVFKYIPEMLSVIKEFRKMDWCMYLARWWQTELDQSQIICSII